jgi:hypothetical protein
MIVKALAKQAPGTALKHFGIVASNSNQNDNRIDESHLRSCIIMRRQLTPCQEKWKIMNQHFVPAMALVAVLTSITCAGAAEVNTSTAAEKDFVAGKLITFNDKGAWCWYQDDRVIVDPVIGTPIDPRDETRLAMHEIFKGVTADGGATWNWTPITRNSTVDNLRPIVPRWDAAHQGVLWLRGSMSRSQDYNMQVVGLVDALK